MLLVSDNFNFGGNDPDNEIHGDIHKHVNISHILSTEHHILRQAIKEVHSQKLCTSCLTGQSRLQSCIYLFFTSV